MNNDWIIWNGGACQVSPDTIVQPQFRDQSRHDAEKNREVSARDTFWAHTGSDNDVIAYRVVSEPLWAEITGYSDDYGVPASWASLAFVTPMILTASASP